MRIFAWRACMNALPTMLNLQRRGVNCCETCPSCGKEAGSISHTILRCDIAKKVWQYWTECPVVFQPEPFDITDTALMILANGTSQDLEIFFGTAWSIQYNRNLARCIRIHLPTPCQNLEFCQKIFTRLLRKLQSYSPQTSPCMKRNGMCHLLEYSKSMQTGPLPKEKEILVLEW